MTADFADVGAAYRKHRLRVMLTITLGYGFIYTCRVGLAIWLHHAGYPLYRRRSMGLRIPPRRPKNHGPPGRP